MNKPYPPLKKATTHRKWLNPDGSGHILWSVSVPKLHTPSGKGHKPWIDGPDVEFVLSDCTRKISLDFECWDKDDNRKKVLKKVDLLLDEVMAFRTALYGAYVVRDALKAKLKGE